MRKNKKEIYKTPSEVIGENAKKISKAINGELPDINIQSLCVDSILLITSDIKQDVVISLVLAVLKTKDLSLVKLLCDYVNPKISNSLMFRQAVFLQCESSNKNKNNDFMEIINFLIPLSDTKALGSSALESCIRFSDIRMFNSILPLSDPEDRSSMALRRALLYYVQVPSKDAKLKHNLLEIIITLIPLSNFSDIEFYLGKYNTRTYENNYKILAFEFYNKMDTRKLVKEIRDGIDEELDKISPNKERVVKSRLM